MINVLRSEWIKLRSVRMNLVLIIIAVAFPLVVAVLTAALINEGDVSTNDFVGLITGTSVITGMLLGVIGAAGITAEFGFGTIRPTFAATPRRSRVIVGKAIVTVLVAFVVEAIVVVACFGIGSAILSSRGASLDLGSSDATGTSAAMVGIVFFAGIVALLGYGLGLLLRSTPASVAVLILWPLVAEGIIAALLSLAGVEHPFKWMPYNSGINLGNPDRGFDAQSLSRIVGGAYFFAAALAVTVTGALFTMRRDA